MKAGRLGRLGRLRGRLGGSTVVLGLMAVVIAAVLPLSALLLAGRWATTTVRASTVAGEHSTADAVAGRVEESYSGALALLQTAPGRPSLAYALENGANSRAQQSLDNLRTTGPFGTIALFTLAGRLIEKSPADGTPAQLIPATGAASGRPVSDLPVQGPLGETAAGPVRPVTVSVTGAGGVRIGYLTADVAVSRVLTDTSALLFGRTGKSLVVADDGTVLMNPHAESVGTRLKSPENLRVVAARRSSTLVLYSKGLRQDVAEAYVPVPGQPWGVLTSQTTAEAFAGLNALTHRLHELAAVFAALGLALAAAVVWMLHARDRRISADTAALAAAQELFHSAFDDAPTGVALTGLDGRLREVNRSLCAITGYPAAELLTMTVDEITHPDDRAADASSVGRVVAGDLDSFDVQKRYVRPDGSIVWVSVSGRAVRDREGRADHVVAHVTDITERRDAAAAMAEAHDQLARARDEAVAATKAKSVFLATMSHEIRTPLNAVIGMTDLLLDTRLEAVQRDFAATVRSSGENLLTIINEILDFSKIEAGELTLERAAFDLRETFDSALAVVTLPADAKGLELVVDVDDGCPEMVVGDATRFQQVVVNLLSNAVKFTHRGEVVVTVLAQRPASATAGGTTSGGGPVRLTVSVSDTGIGIPADGIDRLFQPFTQIDDSTTRSYGGTGLGLVISRRLVEAMGGDLRVTSRPGEGSVFTFTAELQVGPVPLAELGAGSGGGSGAGSGAGSVDRLLAGRRALVVAGHDVGRRVLARRLAGWGVSCTAVATVSEALAAVGAGAAFDVAVIDFELADGDGGRLAAALREAPAGRELPLILLRRLAARVAPEHRALFVAALGKPARAGLLREKVEQALSGGALGAPARTVDPDAADDRSRDLAEDPARQAPVPGRPPARVDSVGGPVLRVLLAEDNPVNQKVAQLMLARLGHRVDTVGDGQEAVDAVRNVAYDVVLMDVQMPQLDGLNATRIIRGELAAEQQPVIIAMTASALVEDRQACEEAGMDAYLSKPVRTSDLRTALAGLRPTLAGLRREPAADRS